MTVDQVLFELCERKILMGRQSTIGSLEAVAMADADGLLKGRDIKGNPIRAKIGGESKAHRLAREARERKKAAG